MKRIVLIAVAILALASMVFGQATGAAQNPSTSQESAGTQAAPASTPSAADSGQSAIAAGTSINAELSKGIDSKKAKENDPVQAKVSQDVVVGGKVVAPRNSRLIGHLTQVKAGGKGEASSVGVAFDKIVLKNGQELPLHAVVQALAPPPRMPASAAYPSGGDDVPSTGGSGGYNTTGGGGMATGGTMPAAGSVGGPMPTNQTANAGTNPRTGDQGGAPTPAGMNSGGQLNASSRGVMGMPGVTLDTSSNSASVLTNEKKNVKLDSGTQMVLRVTAQ